MRLLVENEGDPGRIGSVCLLMRLPGRILAVILAEQSAREPFSTILRTR
jgi:hypothetical protein